MNSGTDVKPIIGGVSRVSAALDAGLPAGFNLRGAARAARGARGPPTDREKEARSKKAEANNEKTANRTQTEGTKMELRAEQPKLRQSNENLTAKRQQIQDDMHLIEQDSIEDWREARGELRLQFERNAEFDVRSIWN